MEIYPKGMAGFRRFLELLDSEPDVENAPDAIDVPYLEGNIEFTM